MDSEMSENIGELAAALARAQAGMGKLIAEHLVKNKDGTTRYRYADLADALETCRATLNAEGIAILQLPATPEQNGITVRTMLAHSSGQWLKTEPLFMPVKGGAQDVGSAITYGRRYQLLAVVGLAPEDDDGARAQESKPESWGNRGRRDTTDRGARPDRRLPSRQPPDLGARCSGPKGSPIANSNSRRRDAISEYDKAHPGDVWQWALREAAVDLDKYAGFGVEPAQLTCADGILVRAVLKSAAGRKGIDDTEDATAKGAP